MAQVLKEKQVVNMAGTQWVRDKVVRDEIIEDTGGQIKYFVLNYFNIFF